MRFERVNPASQLVDPLVRLLRRGAGRLGRRIGLLRRLVNARHFGCHAVDALVNSGDVLVHVFLSSAATQAQAGQNSDTDHRKGFSLQSHQLTFHYLSSPGLGPGPFLFEMNARAAYGTVVFAKSPNHFTPE
jgi:hypothetical protein